MPTALRRVSAQAGWLVVLAFAACRQPSAPREVTVPEASALHSVRVAPRTPSSKPPLLILLHGYGSDEQDLVSLAGELDGRFAVRSVRGPLAMGQGGHAWFPFTVTPDGGRNVDVARAESSRRDIVRFIDEAVAAEGADPERVYLAGFSQGGMMALGVAATEPAKVAGVVAMSARMLPEFLARRASTEHFQGLPVLVVHGVHDGVVPVEHGRATQAALAPLGVALTYREYPMRHEISRASLGLVSSWLTARLDGPRRVVGEAR